MKRLLALILIASVGWSAYWFVGAAGAKRGFEAWFEAREAEGWQAEYADLAVQGFPNRFDANFTQPRLADPDTGLAWQAPFFQVFALSYQPNHLIAVWPPEQSIATPQEKYALKSEDMRASLVLDAGSTLPLNRSTLQAQQLEILSKSSNATTKIRALLLATERLEGEEATYRIGLSADGYAPSLPFRTQIKAKDVLPDEFQTLKLDATITFSRPWDISAIEDSRPQPTAIKLSLAEAHWGDLHLQVAGRLSINEAGVLSGRIVIKAKNWREILALLDATALLPEAWLAPIEQGLTLLSSLSGNSKTLDVPLDFKAGQMALGPIPLGAAPLIKLR